MIWLNDKNVDFESFPNGETKLVEKSIIADNMFNRNVVKFKYENDSDLIKLMFVKKYLDSWDSVTHLVIKYMPYSRMDRVEGTSAFTLKYVSDYINSLNFNSVEIIEPHSDVSAALVNRSYSSYPTLKLLDKVVEEIGFDKENDYLFFPDAGAQKRYSKVTGYKQLVGFKDRDFATGRIKSLQAVGNLEHKNNKVIILDDLCSYGGTFIKSAEQLKALGVSEVYLLVAHCEYSIYKGEILGSDLIDKVYTTNTILNESEHEKIHVFKI